jgi:hydrogenase small subunit
MNDCYECTSQYTAQLVHGVRERIGTGQLQRIKLVWLELTGCSGNIISLLDGNNPDFKYLASQMVQFVYDNSLIVKQGQKAIDQLFSVIGSEFILAVEGAVATKENGIYNIIGMNQGQQITAYDAVKKLGEAATHVIEIGRAHV